MDKQRKEYVSVKLEKPLVARLHALKHPSQTLNGVIQELLDFKDKANG
jgi:hypothetical protein